MNTFSTDADLLRYEPSVFRADPFIGQVLCKGNNGQASGTAFQASGVDFLSRPIRPGHVMYLSDGVGNLDGVYEIVSIDAPTQLTVSVLRSDAEAAPIPIGAGTGLFYRIGTFDAQAAEAAEALTQILAVRPGRPDSPYGIEDIADTRPLRTLAALMVLHMLFGSAYQNPETDGAFLIKRDHYEKLIERARQRCVIRIDVGGDRFYEKTLAGAHAKLMRQ